MAIFSPPGGKEPYLVNNAYNNRTDLVAPNNSAIMTLINLICDDEGFYRCWIHYFIGNNEYEEYSNSSVIFTGKFLYRHGKSCGFCQICRIIKESIYLEINFVHLASL